MKKSIVCITLGMAVFALGCSKEEKKSEGPSKGTVTTTPVTEGPVGVKLISQPVGCKNWEVRVVTCPWHGVPVAQEEQVYANTTCEIPDGWEPFASQSSRVMVRKCR